MQTQRIFLASSNELKRERELFEIAIYRKCKAWYPKGTFLHLDIWEDLSAKMQEGGSQRNYNRYVKTADLVVLLAHTKIGKYTEEEFETAFGEFNETQRPFIYTYFKEVSGQTGTQPSLQAFKEKLKKLNHFYSSFADSNDLWSQFNKELDRLELNNFSKNEIVGKNGNEAIKIYQQKAEKIYNIDKIDKADFS